MSAPKLPKAYTMQETESPPIESLELDPVSLPVTPDNTDTSRTPLYVPLETLRHLVMAEGHSYAEVARRIGITTQSVQERCKKHGILSVGAIKLLRDQKPDIIDSKWAMVMKHLTDDKVKEASAYQLVGMQSMLHGQARLENDQSTGNIAVLIEDNTKLTSARQALEDELASVVPNDGE